MTTWLDMKNRLKGLDIDKAAINAVKVCPADLVEWQKEQLWIGRLSSGGFIRPPYRPVTKRIKRAKGQPTDRVTLKDKGDFHEGIFADVDNEGWTLESTDEKSIELQEKYTPKIFGLNKASLEGLKTDVAPNFIAEIIKSLGL